MLSLVSDLLWFIFCLGLPLYWLITPSKPEEWMGILLLLFMALLCYVKILKIEAALDLLVERDKK